MEARASDEAAALAAAAPLARRVSLNFRDPQAQRVVREQISDHGRPAVTPELRQRLTEEIVVAFAEMTRGEPLPVTHAGRRCVMDPGKLFIWELDGWLVARARSRLVESLRLLDPQVRGDDRLVPVPPRLLEEPGRRWAEGTWEIDAIMVAEASAAERRAMLVAEPSAVAAPVRLRPQKLELGRLIARKVRGLTPLEREALLEDPAVRAGLAKNLGFTPRPFACTCAGSSPPSERCNAEKIVTPRR